MHSALVENQSIRLTSYKSTDHCHGLERLDDATSLRNAIRELCLKSSIISMSQIIPENILLHDCLSENASGVRFIEVLPTDICNHGCSWCFTATSRSVRVLPAPKLRERLDRFIANGGKTILLSGGGEPLLYKPLSNETPEFDGCTVIEWLAMRDVSVGVITNGVHLDRFMEANSKFLSALAFIRVSLDACTPEEYTLRHSAKIGDFDRVANGIKSAVGQRGIHMTPAIGVSFVVDGDAKMNSRMDDIEKIRQLAIHFGVDFVQLKHAHTNREHIADALMSHLSESSSRLIKERPEFWIHRYLTSRASPHCNLPSVGQLLRTDGARSPCCHLQEVAVPEFGSGGSGFTPFTVQDCHSPACRYVSMNRFISKVKNSPAEYMQALTRLKTSLELHGFHPYRLFPSAPDLAVSPFAARECL